jgi:hypothetical protein
MTADVRFAVKRCPMTTDDARGTGTPTDPWQLNTPPGSSAFEAYRDPDADPPALVVQAGRRNCDTTWRASRICTRC